MVRLRKVKWRTYGVRRGGCLAAVGVAQEDARNRFRIVGLGQSVFGLLVLVHWWVG